MQKKGFQHFLIFQNSDDQFYLINYLLFLHIENMKITNFILFEEKDQDLHLVDMNHKTLE